VVEVGDPEQVGTRYLELNFSEVARDDAAHARALGVGDRIGDGDAEILEAWFENEAGERVATVPAGGRCTFAARVRFVADVEDPLFGVVLQNDRRETVLAASNLWSNPQPGRFSAGSEIGYRVRFDNLLVPGRYQATPAVARQGAGIAWIDRRERMVSLLVSGHARTDAIVDLPYEVSITAASPAPEGVAS
jgi:hypothetical protein